MICDSETGELCPEPETGERQVHYSSINVETGESEFLMNIHSYKTPFRIQTGHIRPRKQHRPKEAPTKPLESQVKFGGAIVLLIPSLLFANIYLAVMIISTEMILHIWCHKKNRETKDPNKFYRSPLHLLTKEHCARCKEETMGERFHKFQDIRYDRFKKYGLESLRRVVS